MLVAHGFAFSDFVWLSDGDEWHMHGHAAAFYQKGLSPKLELRENASFVFIVCLAHQLAYIAVSTLQKR